MGDYIYRAQFVHIVDGKETPVSVEADSWDELYTGINSKFADLDIVCAVTDFYSKNIDLGGDWVWMHQKRYFASLCFPEFMFLQFGNQHTGGFSAPFQCRCLHIPTRQIILISHRHGISMGENFLNSPRMVKYNFKYVKKDDTSEPFVAFAIIEDGLPPDDSQRVEFKQNVLRKAAQWFCEHITADYDSFF